MRQGRARPRIVCAWYNVLASPSHRQDARLWPNVGRGIKLSSPRPRQFQCCSVAWSLEGRTWNSTNGNNGIGERGCNSFPHQVHCYGTGSCRSEPGAGGLMHHTRNRTGVLGKTSSARISVGVHVWAGRHIFTNAGLCQIQSFFRRNALYRGQRRDGREWAALESFAAPRIRRRMVRLLVIKSIRAASALLPQPQASALRAPQRFQRERCGRVHTRLRKRGAQLFA